MNRASLWRVLRPYRWRLAGAGVLAAVAEAAGVALLATATWLLVTAAGQPPVAALTVAIVLVRTLAIGRGVLRYLERLTGHDAVLRALAELRARVFAALVEVGSPAGAARPPAGRGDPPAPPARRPSDPDPRPGPAGARDPAGVHSGDLLSRIVSDVDAVQDLLLRVLVPGGAAAAVALSALVVTAVVSPAAAAALAAGLVVAGLLLPATAAGLVHRRAARLAPLRGELTVDTLDLTRGVADLTAFGALDRATARARARADRLAGLESRLAAGRFALDAAGTLVAGLTAAGVLAVATADRVDGVLSAVLTVGALAAVEAALGLVEAARRWVELRAPLDRVAGLLAKAPPAAAVAADPPAAVPAEPAAAVPADPVPPVTLVARGLRVRYRRGAAPALAGVDLTLEPGRRVAVVGPSGAGKSTLLAVLAGSVPPDAGTVGVVGPAGTPYRPERWPVGGLLADPYVFHTTVRENLLLGRSGVTPAELAAAVGAAGLAGWLERQPAGYDTVVGEDGGQLSGGQRQRVALARALVAAPPVLLLDEPTEGLAPADADAVLGSVLTAAGPRRSVLVVTHRLRALADGSFDEIVVLEDGRVTGRGRHGELVDRPGWYRDRFLAQELAEREYQAVA